MAFAKKEVDPKFKIDPTKATKDQLKEALELLAKKNERADRIKRGELKSYAGAYKPYSELTDAQKAKVRGYAHKRLVRQSLLVAKAKAAGISVSEKEVDEYLARRKGK